MLFELLLPRDTSTVPSCSTGGDLVGGGGVARVCSKCSIDSGPSPSVLFELRFPLDTSTEPLCVYDGVVEVTGEV